MAARDLRLDTLRGIFLVLMTIDHIGGKIIAFTYEPFGFVSAAAGFVILSGYMYAFTTRNTASNRRALMVQSWVRAARLYRYHVALFAILVLLTLISPLHRAYLANALYPGDMTPLDAILYGVALLHQPLQMGLLPMYLLLSLLSPALLMAFRREWYAPIFIASLAFWAWGQFFDPLEWLAAVSGGGVHAGAFNLLSWQLLWVSGLYIGYVHGVEKRTIFFNSPLWLGLAVVLAAGFFLARHAFVDMPDRLDFFVENSDLRALRLLNIFSQAVIFIYLVRFLPRDKSIPWLRFLGKYSLPVFCFQVLLVAFLEPVSWRVGAHFGYTAELAYLAAAAASLSIPAMLYQEYEVQLRALGGRNWAGRVSAMRAVVRELGKARRKPHSAHVD
jgi:hypothetical protein